MSFWKEISSEKDGFPRKIRVGKLIKPGKGDKGKGHSCSYYCRRRKLLTIRFVSRKKKQADQETDRKGKSSVNQQVREEGEPHGAGAGQEKAVPMKWNQVLMIWEE